LVDLAIVRDQMALFDALAGPPLKERKALLEKIAWQRPLFSAVCKLDLEGIVAKRMAAAYWPQDGVPEIRSMTAVKFPPRPRYRRPVSGCAIRSRRCESSR
jgi:hypothetical protein